MVERKATSYLDQETQHNTSQRVAIIYDVKNDHDFDQKNQEKDVSNRDKKISKNCEDYQIKIPARHLSCR